MGKSEPLSRVEYEEKVEKHINAVRRLMKRFNPEANYVNMCIIDDSQWAITYLPNEDGKSRQISDWYRKLTNKGGVGPFYRSDLIPDGSFVTIDPIPNKKDEQQDG